MNKPRKRTESRIGIALLLTAACAAVCFGLSRSVPDTAYPANPTGCTVVVNEIAADALPGVENAEGESCNWAELYNYGTQTVDLSGFGFSDDADAPFRYTFPHGTLLPGGGYCLLLSARSPAAPSADPRCVPFAFSGEETLLLTDPQGRTVDRVTLPRRIECGYTVGRTKQDCTSFAVLAAPTPADFNRSAVIRTLPAESDALPAPTFSVEGGFYTQPFLLELHTDVSGAQIRYTTDGSEPDAHSALYTGPIAVRSREGEPNRYTSVRTAAGYWRFLQKPSEDPVYKGTVIRAKCCRDGVLSAACATQTYFIDPHYTLPVVSVTTDPDRLFDEDDGLYTPGQDLRLWKKYNPSVPYKLSPTFLHISDAVVGAHVELFEPGGTRAFSEDVGLSITGKVSSRNRCKSLSVRFGKKYGGTTALRYDLFASSGSDTDGSAVKTFREIVLRNGGGDPAGTMLHDAFLQRQLSAYFETTLAYRPCIVFIDGEYWGLHNIREAYSPSYFETHFGVREDRLDMIRYSSAPAQAEIGGEENVRDFLALCAYAASHDLSVSQHFAYIEQRLDLENTAKYFAVETYLNNADFFDRNNVRVWRSDDPQSQYGDGKWRFALFDLDVTLLPELKTDLLRDQIFGENASDDDAEYIVLFRALLQNPRFRALYLRQIDTLADSVFAPQTVCPLLDEAVRTIEPEMREHYARWHMDRGFVGVLLDAVRGKRETDDFAVWQQRVAAIRAQLAGRPAQMRALLRAVFGDAADDKEPS